jgi:hypothetical protein
MNPKSDQDIDRVRAAARGLIEHFDTVQIFCTRHEGPETGTTRVTFGLGNWFARFGQAVEWTEKEREVSRGETRRENDP